MIKKYIHRITQIVLMACLVFTTTGCRETIMSIFSVDIEEGEEVMFTTSLPTAAALTRTEPSYTAPKENYKFTIGMYTDDTHKVGEGIYNTIINDEIGTLKAEKPLYWHSTQIAYGFKATAGTTDLKADQSTEENQSEIASGKYVSGLSFHFQPSFSSALPDSGHPAVR